MKPPLKLDDATVVEWAWSDVPFGIVNDGDHAIRVHGLAIATYDNNVYYRFSCDNKWNVVQDCDYDSIDTAKKCLPTQYNNDVVQWSRLTKD